MFTNEQLPELYVMSGFDMIDEIADELLAIEESARFYLGTITRGDQLLRELNFPVVEDLVHLPERTIWKYPSEFA